MGKHRAEAFGGLFRRVVDADDHGHRSTILLVRGATAGLQVHHVDAPFRRPASACSQVMEKRIDVPVEKIFMGRDVLGGIERR